MAPASATAPSPLSNSAAAVVPGQIGLSPGNEVRLGVQSPVSNHGSPVGKENELQRLREEKKRYTTDLQELKYVADRQDSDWKRKEKATRQQKMEADRAIKVHSVELQTLRQEEARMANEFEAAEQARQHRVEQKRSEVGVHSRHPPEVEQCCSQKQIDLHAEEELEVQLVELEAQLRSIQKRTQGQCPEQQPGHADHAQTSKMKRLEDVMAEQRRLDAGLEQMRQEILSREAYEKMKRDSMGGCSPDSDVARSQDALDALEEARQQTLEKQVELKREEANLEMELRALEEMRVSTLQKVEISQLGTALAKASQPEMPACGSDETPDLASNSVDGEGPRMLIVNQETIPSTITTHAAANSNCSTVLSSQQPEAVADGTEDGRNASPAASSISQAPAKAAGKGSGRAPGPPPPKGSAPKGPVPKGPGPKGSVPKGPVCKSKAQSVARTSLRNGFINVYWRQSVEPLEAEMSMTDDKFLDRFHLVLDRNQQAADKEPSEIDEEENEIQLKKPLEKRQTLYDSPCETSTLPPPIQAYYFKTREAAVDMKKGSSTNDSWLEAPQKKAQLMDDKRQRMLGILIRKFRMQRKVNDDREAVNLILEAVLRCDYSCLPAESLSLLRTVLRQHAEDGSPVNKFVEVHGQESLNGIEHAPLYTLVYGLSKVQELDERLECMLFENSFEESFSKCRDQLKTLFDALNVLTSKREVIQRFFHTALRLGNALNKDSNAPVLADGGFKLCSLEKLQATKSSKIPRASLFHFVVILMENDDVDELCCPEDWNQLRAASCVRSYTVYQQCVELLRGYHYIEQFVQSAPKEVGDDGKLSQDMFLERMRGFTENRKDNIEYVQRFCIETFTTYKELGVYFDDVRGVYPPPQKDADSSEDLIMLFSSFAQTVVNARDEVKDLRLKEELLGACPWLDSPLSQGLRSKSVPDLRIPEERRDGEAFKDKRCVHTPPHGKLADASGINTKSCGSLQMSPNPCDESIPPIPFMKQLSQPMMTPPHRDPKRPSILKRLNDVPDEPLDHVPSDVSEWDGSSSASSPAKRRANKNHRSHGTCDSHSLSPNDASPSSASPKKQDSPHRHLECMRSLAAPPKAMTTPPRIPTGISPLSSKEDCHTATPIGPPPLRSPPSRKIVKKRSSHTQKTESGRKSLSSIADKIEASFMHALVQNGDLAESGSDSGKEGQKATHAKCRTKEKLAPNTPDLKALTSEVRAEWKRRRSRPLSPRQVDLPTVAEQGETPYRNSQRNGADSD